MKNPENFKEAPKGSTQEEFERLVAEDIEKRKKAKKEKPDNKVEISNNPEDKEEIFEGVEPKKEKAEEKDKKEDFDMKKETQRLREIEDILKAEEGLRADNPENRAKMIGAFKKEGLKKEKALILENLEKNKAEKKEEDKKEDFDMRKAMQRLGEIEDILKAEEGLRADNPENRAKMIGSFKKEGLKKEKELILEDLKKNGIADLKDIRRDDKTEINIEPPAPLRKRGRPRNEDKEEVEKQTKDWDKEDSENEEIKKYREDINKKVAEKVKESKKNKKEESKEKQETISADEIEAEEIKTERREAGISYKEEVKNKIEEIKKVINKELSEEEKIALAEKHLEELKSTAKERRENIKENRDEFNRLFNSENVMGNFINKLWWESDKHDKLNGKRDSLERELEATEKEIEEVRKLIQEKKFQEDKKMGMKEKLPPASFMTDAERLDSRKEELKNDLEKIDFKTEEVQKEKNLLVKIKETGGSKDVSKGIEKKNEELKKLAGDRKIIEKDYYSLFTQKEMEDEMDDVNKRLGSLSRKGLTDKELAKKVRVLNEKMAVLGEVMGNLIK